MTSVPLRARFMAVLRPKPRLAPVIRAFLWVGFISVLLFFCFFLNLFFRWMLSHPIDMITFSSASEFAQYLVRQLPARMPVPSLPFRNLRTSGNSRPSATNLASKGEPLSFPNDHKISQVSQFHTDTM